MAVCLLAAHWAYREICRASADHREVLQVAVLTNRPALYRARGSVPLRWPEPR